MRAPILEDIFSRRGAVTAIAAKCGLTTAAVSQWRRVPTKHLDAVAAHTGLSTAVLRPDLIEPKAAQEAA